MDLRQLDPAIGRWVVQDPVIHHEFSPYSAFDNNPVYWADPSGADAISWIDSEGNLLGASFSGADAMDAFLFLTGQSSADFLETLTMQVYEFDDIDDSGGSGGGNGNGGGKREGYRPTFGEAYSVFANNSNFPLGWGVNLFHLNMSMLTGKDRHLYGPDAVVFTKTVEGGAGVGGTVGFGIIVFTRGEHKGKAYRLTDAGAGISSIDISTVFTVQGLYYSGSLGDLN